MMIKIEYKLKLIRGRSYAGYGIKATAKKPLITVSNKKVVDYLVSIKRFTLVEIIETDEDVADITTPANTGEDEGDKTQLSVDYPKDNPPNDSWSVAQLKAYATERGLDVTDERHKAPILAKIAELEQSGSDKGETDTEQDSEEENKADFGENDE